jgi:adenosylhomocysteinase
MTEHDVKDLSLAPVGKLKIEWAEQSMPVLRQVRERFAKEQPLKGVRLGACLHVTTETAVLMMTLKAGGAQVALCASNPLSTQDDTAAALVKEYGIPVFAQKGEDNKRYYGHLEAVLKTGPQVTMDDGADLISQLHGENNAGTSLVKNVIGGTEETTTGVIRLRAMQREGVLAFPVIAVNDADTKHLFETTATAPASPRSTVSCGPRTSFWRARSSPSRATACVAAALPRAPTAWART